MKIPHYQTKWGMTESMISQMKLVVFRAHNWGVMVSVEPAQHNNVESLMLWGTWME